MSCLTLPMTMINHHLKKPGKVVSSCEMLLEYSFLIQYLNGEILLIIGYNYMVSIKIIQKYVRLGLRYSVELGR